jgi:cytochrome P450
MNGMSRYSAPGPRGVAAARVIAGFANRPLGSYRDLAAYGDIVEMPLYPGRRLFVVSRPEYAEHVLVRNQDNYVKAFTYRPLRIFLGSGLLTSEGETWRRHRRLVQPVFSRRQVLAFAPQMVGGARRTLSHWDTLPSGIVIDVAAQLSRLTLDVVGRVLFGADLGGEAVGLGRAMTRAQRGMGLAAFLPFLWGPKASRAIVTATRGFWGTIEAVDAPVRGVIAARRAAGAVTEPRDLLDLLIVARDEADGSAFTDDEIRDEVATLMLAGHETTAVALAWSLALLSAHPYARDRLEEEVDALPADPAVTDVDRLPWTQAVVSEAMRIYPPAWTVERDALDDDEVDGVRIPPGSTVAVPPYLVHRHPATWPNPEGFDPRRFLPRGERPRDEGPGRERPGGERPGGERPGAEAERHRYAYIPFGGGRRGCVGAGFAQLESVLVLATLTRRYRLDLVAGGLPDPIAHVTLRPGKHLPMRLTRR